MTNSENLLGKKVKNFRQRASMSQLELENLVNLSNGTISRIESGAINPTKETLMKIISALKLQSYEASDLFSINSTNQLAEVIKIIKELSSKDNIDEILQNSADNIAKELNLLGIGILKVENNTVFAHTFTKTWYSELMNKITKIPLNSIAFSLTKNTDNLIVQSINTKSAIYTESLADALKPFIPKVWKLEQKLIGLKSMIIYPLIYENEPLGALVFAKNYYDQFEHELEIFKALSEHISMSLVKARKYNDLMKEISNLKQQKESLYTVK